jgi:hypothetical protein
MVRFMLTQLYPGGGRHSVSVVLDSPHGLSGSGSEEKFSSRATNENSAVRSESSLFMSDLSRGCIVIRLLICREDNADG